MQVQVVRKEFSYNHRRHVIGAFVDMHPKHVPLFMASGLVRLPEPPRADIPASPSMPVTITEDDGDYEREDMQAEISPRTGKPKRAYRRRDMRTED